MRGLIKRKPIPNVSIKHARTNFIIIEIELIDFSRILNNFIARVRKKNAIKTTTYIRCIDVYIFVLRRITERGRFEKQSRWDNELTDELIRICRNYRVFQMCL